jgi:5-methylcytosine-specific restriction enzyme B
MSLKERVKAFCHAASDFYGTPLKDLRKNFGVSNSARIVGGGVQLGVANLDKVSTGTEQIVICCMIRLPPEDEIFFAVQIKSDMTNLIARLDKMRAIGQAQKAAGQATVVGGPESGGDEDELEVPEEGADLLYSERNNVTAVYLAPDGKLYLRNKEFWDTLNFDLTPVGPGVQIDKILFSIWPAALTTRRGLLARQFIGYLGSLVDREKIHEINVWSAEGAISAEMRRMPAAIPLADIEAAVTAMGGHYPGGEVARLHGGLNFLPGKHFVILSGLSGSGKTQLALKYAMAVHGVKEGEPPDPFLVVCPVRPEWTDPTGLTGYHDVLMDRYVVPQFLQAVLLAVAHRDTPVFVVLDEMNLARVEYYFSDVLSAIETGHPLQLHSNSVAYEGSGGVSVPDSIAIPPNLYIVGTINVDETTNPVSDKVLDRAIVLDMSNIDLVGFLAGLEARDPSLAGARAACEAHLTAVQTIMEAHGLGFGYRVAGEALRYHVFAAEKLGSGAVSVTDDLMVQKILVKLRGGERQRPMLTGLSKALDGLPRSQAFLARLTSDLDEFGSFQAGR